MSKILFSVLMFFLSCSAVAGELWQGLDSGAYTQQVIKKFPSAKRDSNRDIPKEFDNRLVMHNYLVFGKPFDVYFLMKDDKLKKVLLNIEMADVDALRPHVFDALVLNYGAPSYYGISMVEWYFNGTEIRLLSGGENLYISYSTNIVDNAKKL